MSEDRESPSVLDIIERLREIRATGEFVVVLKDGEADALIEYFDNLDAFKRDVFGRS